METSFLIARLVGPVLFVLGLYVVLMPARVTAMAEEVLASPALLMIAGILAFVPGLAIVNAHNLWTGDWRVAVTLIGWIALVAGLARLLLPHAMQSLGQQMLRHRAILAGPGALMIALGGFLSYKGYLG